MERASSESAGPVAAAAVAAVVVEVEPAREVQPGTVLVLLCLWITDRHMKYEENRARKKREGGEKETEEERRRRRWERAAYVALTGIVL